ncbi:hypothetical protein BDM02DRAFT_3122404 [Thelephora ganbajun]|uniref:Uncharacterized protein n=1 Tax=Thelephora ganbajun TaxID=370292 RepID=A0ACB6Z497_THEGA|nr:hypothetical protein BDM02DRAFT_3122404 [Thelephora ganbajun]
MYSLRPCLRLVVVAEFPANEHSSNLLRACTNGIQASISKEPPSWILVDVPVPAKTPHGLQRDLNRIGKVFVRSISAARGVVSFSANWWTAWLVPQSTPHG